jgi:dihydroorotase
VIGLETALPLSIALFGSGVSGRRRLVEALSAAPARILGLKTKGRLSRGADADVTLVDPEEAFVVAAPFVSKSRNSPFLGMKLKGRARALVVGGRIAFLRPRGGGGP